MFSFGGNTGTTANTNSANTSTGSTFGQPSSAFSFGTPAASNPTTTATTTTTATGPSLFGNAPAAPSSTAANTGASSLFSSSTFGTGSNAPTTPFQQQQQQPSSSFQFQSNQPSLQQQQQQQQPQPIVTSPSTYPFQYLQQCFDPSSANYRFRAFFYNVADDLTDQQRLERQTAKPPNVSDSLWAQVQADNPDPARMIPVLANGFADLEARAKWEDEALKAHAAKLDELHAKSAQLLRELDVDLTAKLAAAQQRHQALSLRLLKIMRVFEVLRRTGNRVSPAESDAITRLRQASVKLATGALEATALRTTAFQLNSLADAGRLDAFKSAKALKCATEEARGALVSVLTEAQQSLHRTVDSVLKDAQDIEVIRAGYRPL